MIRGVHKNGRPATGNWTRAQIARERAVEAAREELEHGFRGPATDEVMVRYMRCLKLVYGCRPGCACGGNPDRACTVVDGWDAYEPNTYAGE